MHLKTRTTSLSIFTSIALFASFSFYLSRILSPGDLLRPLSPATHITYDLPRSISSIISEQQQQQQQQDHHQTQLQLRRPRRADVDFPFVSRPDSILLPDWEVFLVLPLGTSPSSYCGTIDDNQCFCVYPNNETSPARLTGVLPFSNRTAFMCDLPTRTRRTLPFPQPILAKSCVGFPPEPSVVILRWNFLAYESLSTDDDVILFVKGVNNRQGVNRAPEEFRCVFGDGAISDDNSVIRTPVTSSNQEVFRCHHPNVTSIRRLSSNDHQNQKIKISLELIQEKKIAPSVTYYYYHAPEKKLKIAGNDKKALLCACSMVYNVAKFLREWILYHSRIGVEKFILYDNGSDDDLENVVKKLLEEEGEEYDVETIWWPWPKTQEAGFSHCATYARDACTWMMYIDVDEFVFSPSWLNALHPSSHMLTSLIPMTPPSASSETTIGQISMLCYEFGPSKQRAHPIKGVTQGYTCRRKEEQRHKSMVLLEAVDTPLLNAIHHFQLKRGYTWKKLREGEGVVNHYKYQAWPEFKKKFRRRVSAYVVDWRQELNPKSNDRTPGLGFEPVEPEGWAERFCEVRDERLKVTTRRWFGVRSGNGYKMAWQDE